LLDLPLPLRSLAMQAEDITVILQCVGRGEEDPGDRLLPLVYQELRRIAATKMARESAGHTLQPTALVHEAWLRLGGDDQPTWKNRAHFFSAAAEAMRRILIDRARRKQAERRGGTVEKVSANATGFDLPAPQLNDEELLLLNEAMDNLTTHDSRKAEIVKLWYFVGLTVEEVAKTLEISDRTVRRDWNYARAWLMTEMARLRG
jgi:RNA polymerase sigma factor (TIGR02999 family)